MALDDLDKRLLQYLCKGTNSYEELARLCNVSRNTVYKRIALLENTGVIRSTIRCNVNYDQLDITPVILGASVPTIEEDKVFNLLASHQKIRFLWRTFGDHNLELLAFCCKGEEGKLIDSIKAVLEGAGCTKIHVATGYVWEKSEVSPFDQEPELDCNMSFLKQSR